jgi:hypothetical protein
VYGEGVVLPLPRTLHDNLCMGLAGLRSACSSRLHFRTTPSLTADCSNTDAVPGLGRTMSFRPSLVTLIYPMGVGPWQASYKSGSPGFSPSADSFFGWHYAAGAGRPIGLRGVDFLALRRAPSVTKLGNRSPICCLAACLMRYGGDSFSPSSWEPQEEGMMNIAARFFPQLRNQVTRV